MSITTTGAVAALMASALVPATVTFSTAPLPRSPGPAIGALVAEPVDLGTLGGEESVAVAIDGNLVVGSAQTAGGAWHAFVVDVTDPELVLRDLGTLGGADSVATDVEGTLVVGVAETTTDAFPHNFVLDLGDADPELTDLGPAGNADYWIPGLPGLEDRLPVTDEGVVVGRLMTKHRPRGSDVIHAFAYDTTAATAQVRDLGTLGGENSTAVDVDDRVVVGHAERPPTPVRGQSTSHAFAYDLTAADPKMIDLGTLGRRSEAVAVEAGVVVGNSITPKPALQERAFVYDLNAAGTHMVDLGSLGTDRSSSVNDVRDGLALGSSSVQRRGRARAVVWGATVPDAPLTPLGTLGAGSFARGSDGRFVFGGLGMLAFRPTSFVYDLQSPDPEMVEIGPLRNRRWTLAVDADEGVVVGRAGDWWATRSRAVIWPLAYTEDPAIHFVRWRQRVEEDAGTLAVEVERTGASTGPSTVEYHGLRVAYGARSGKDFEPIAGTITFAPGQTHATLPIKLIDDDRGEGSDDIGLRLRAAQGAVIGAVRTMEIIIRTNDWPPDLMAATPDTEGLVGNNVYNEDGRNQTVSQDAAPGDTALSRLRLCNDGRPREGTFRAAFALRASADQPGSRITYRGAGRDLTAKLRSHEGLQVRLEPGGVPCYKLKVRTHLSTTAIPGSVHSARLTAASEYEPELVDTTISRVRVLR